MFYYLLNNHSCTYFRIIVNNIITWDPPPQDWGYQGTLNLLNFDFARKRVNYKRYILKSMLPFKTVNRLPEKQTPSPARISTHPNMTHHPHTIDVREVPWVPW